MDVCVVAVTVTYNDYDYLKRALDALRKQTVSLAHVIVVDNNSSEKNRALLAEELDSLVDVLWLEDNLGGAGGFEHGMRYAHDKYNPDWYWLMDADAYPQPNCLERLLVHRHDSENVGILAPLIFGVDQQQYQFYHIKSVSRFLYRDLPLYSSADEIPPGISHIEADAFVGPMVSRRAVEKVGYADGELFIYGDDQEYTYRVSRKLDVLLVKEAVINHRDVSETGEQIPTAWWKDYYAFRNRILFIREFQRNFLYGTVGQGMFLLRIFKALLKNRMGQYNAGLKKYRRDLIFRAVKDGYAGRKGKTVDPVAEKEKVKVLEGQVKGKAT